MKPATSLPWKQPMSDAAGAGSDRYTGQAPTDGAEVAEAAGARVEAADDEADAIGGEDAEVAAPPPPWQLNVSGTLQLDVVQNMIFVYMPLVSACAFARAAAAFEADVPANTRRDDPAMQPSPDTTQVTVYATQ